MSNSMLRFIWGEDTVAKLQEIGKGAWGSGRLEGSSGGYGYMGKIGNFSCKFNTLSKDRTGKASRREVEACNMLRVEIGNLCKNLKGKDGKEVISKDALSKICAKLGIVEDSEGGFTVKEGLKSTYDTPEKTNYNNLLKRSVVANVLKIVEEETKSRDFITYLDRNRSDNMIMLSTDSNSSKYTDVEDTYIDELDNLASEKDIHPEKFAKPVKFAKIINPITKKSNEDSLLEKVLIAIKKNGYENNDLSDFNTDIIIAKFSKRLLNYIENNSMGNEQVDELFKKFNADSFENVLDNMIKQKLEKNIVIETYENKIIVRDLEKDEKKLEKNIIIETHENNLVKVEYVSELDLNFLKLAPHVFVGTILSKMNDADICMCFKPLQKEPGQAEVNPEIQQ